MKLQTVNHSEPPMRFFTTELYIRFNSSNDEEADEANDAWETALMAYRKHLDGIRDHMPAQVRKLAGLCFHDAELLGYDQAVEPQIPLPFGPVPPLWSAIAIVSVKNHDRIVSLVYVLWDRIREYPSPEDWPFSKERIHWLYDEVDLAPADRGTFLHRVLLSDGRVLAIPFLSVFIHSVALTPPSEGLGVRKELGDPIVP